MIVDVHEPKLFERLKTDEVNCKLQSMVSADILIETSSPPILIERKTWGDFLGSWYSGRLPFQIQKMYATKVNDSIIRPAILLEGSLGMYLKFRHAKRSIPSIAGILASVFYDWNVPIIPSLSLGMSSLILKSIDKKSMPSDGKEKSVRIMTSEISRTDCRLNMLGAIDGIGAKTAKILIDKFSTIAAICEASEETLKLAVGKVVAKNILKAFHS